MAVIESFPDEEDTRKVQTAVVGGAGADWPVFLPYDHDGFDRFMHGRGRDDFYCGTLLGGCGKILTVRRSERKKCHFAHRPPVLCRRTAVGEDSADHLYIGQALRRWLQKQSYQSVSVKYLDHGFGPGGAVEVRFGAGRQMIKVQMGRLPLRDWQTERAPAHDGGAAVIHWAYGPGSGLARTEASEHGHAIRFECRTVDDMREVYVGTQFTDHSLEWVPLTETHLGDTGLVTPRLAQHVSEQADVEVAALVAFPLLPGSIAFTGTVDVTNPGDENRTYDADVQPRGSALIRARISMPDEVEQPQPHRLHVIDGTAHLRQLSALTGSGPTWVIHADGCSPLAEPRDPRWPDLRPRKQVDVPTMVEVAAPELDLAAPAVARATSEVPLVQAFRAKLTQLARSRGIINWETLVSSAGAVPGDFTFTDRIRLLIAVDFPRAEGKPVLSSLVKLRGERPGAPLFFADILAGLGRSAVHDEGTLKEIHRREMLTAYAIARGETVEDVSRSMRAQKERAHVSQSPTPTPRAATTVGGNRTSRQGPVSTFNHKAAVKSVQNALIDAAVQQRCVGWQLLAAAVGHPPEDFKERHRIAILVDVDRANAASGVLLSSLVIGPGHTPVPYFDTILKRLGRPHGLRPIELGTVRKTEQARVFAVYGNGQRALASLLAHAEDWRSGSSPQ